MRVSTDRRKVFLELAGLAAGKVLVIKAAGVRSGTGDIPRCPAGWYTLNAISGSEPFSLPTPIRMPRETVSGANAIILQRVPGGFNAMVSTPGRHRLRISDAKGVVVAVRTGAGPAVYRLDRLGPGIHIAELIADGLVAMRIFAD